MQNNKEKKSNKKRGAMIVLSLCLVGGAAYGTYYTMEQAELSREQERDQAKVEEILQEATEEDFVLETESEKTQEAGSQNAIAKKDNAADLVKETEEETEGEVVDADAAVSPTVAYDDNTDLVWPTAGTLVLDYSMDKAVYFPTLQQYKYNPAVILGADVGSQVVASAKGIVKSIDVTEETGSTLVLDIGNGYELTYGQLKEIAVSQGDLVETGTLLGYVSEPTKYYTQEGSNLFYEMTKDGDPVDPFLYLE